MSFVHIKVTLNRAGEVVKVGSEVTDWKVGDRVMSILPGGGYAQCTMMTKCTLIRGTNICISDCAIPSAVAMPIPKNFSYAEAAAIPEAFLTAYQGTSLLKKMDLN